MGLLALPRSLSMQRDRRRRQNQSRMAKRKGSPCQQDGDPQGDKRIRYSVPELPEEIWHNIHSLLPLPDAARAGCVSRTFLNFWRCHPYLIFSRETLGLNGNACGGSKVARIFINRVDSIMRRHSGIGVKTFQLHCFCSDFNPSYLNRWLQIAITPGEYLGRPIRVSSIQFLSFGEAVPQSLQEDHLPEDTLAATQAQLPDSA